MSFHGDQDVRVALDVLEHLLEVPQAVLDAAHEELHDRVARLSLFGFLARNSVHEVRRARRRTTCEKILSAIDPRWYRTVRFIALRIGPPRHVVPLPVKRRDGAGSDHDAEAGDELRRPENAEEVVQGHVLQRLVPRDSDRAVSVSVLRSILPLA